MPALSERELKSIARGYKFSSSGIVAYFDQEGHVCEPFRPEALTAPVEEHMCPQAVRKSFDNEAGRGEKIVDALFVFSEALELEIYRKLAVYKPQAKTKWKVILQGVSSGRPRIQISQS